MADETIKKVLDFEVKLNDADAKILATARAIEETEKELKLFNETRKLNIKLTDEQVLKEAELKVKLQANKEEYRALTNIQKQKALANKAEIGSIDQLNKLYKAAEAELKRLGGQYTRNKDGSIQLTNAHANERQEVKQLFEQLKAYDAGLSNHRLNVGNYTNSIVGLENQLTALREEIKTLDLGSKEFVETKKKIDDVNFSLQVATGKIDELGNREARNKLKEGFSDAQQSIGAMTQSLTLLTVAFKDNENAGAIVNKVLQGLAVTQTALVVIQAKKSIQDTAEIVLTRTKIVLGRIYTTVIKGATAAQTAFNATIAGLLVTGAVLGITKLIEKFKSHNDEIDTAIEKEKEFQTILGERQAIASKFAENFQKDAKDIIQQNQDQIDSLEAQGATTTEVLNKKKELVDLEIKSAETLKAVVRTEAEKIGLDIYLNRLTSEQTDLTRQLTEERKKLAEQNTQESEEREKNRKAAFEKLKSELETQFIELRTSLTDEGELNLQKFKFIKDSILSAYGISPEEAEEILLQHDNLLKNISASNEAYTNNLKTQMERESQDREDYYKRVWDITSSFTQQTGNLISEALTSEGNKLENFAKSFITLILDTLEKTLIASIAAVTAKSIEAYAAIPGVGLPVGLASAALKIAAITAAFETAKALLNKPSEGFYEGGEVEVAGNKNVKDGTVWQNQYGQKIKTHAGEKMFVLNPAASDEFKKLSWLSSFNQYFGGRGMKGTHTALYDGGIANTSVINRMNSGIDYNKLAEALSRNGAPTLVFKDFDIAYGKYKSSEGLVSLG